MTAGPPPVVRPALPADTPLYSAAAERFFRQTYGNDAGHAAVMDRHCAKTFAPEAIRTQLGNPKVTTLIATQGQAIVALAQMLASDGAGEVERFYVDAAWHGQGIAQTMMARLISTAEAAGLESLHLGVWIRNDRAIAFYRQQGFHPEGTVEFLLDGVPQSDLLMRRPLSQGAGTPRTGANV